VNIFQMQAELSRQWLELSLAAARAGLESSAALQRQAAAGWMQALGAASPPASPMLPMLPTMPSPAAMFAAWPMMPQPTAYTTGWGPALSAALWPWQAALGMRAWDLPAATMMGSPAALWPWLWGAAWSGGGHSFFPADRSRASGAEIIEQMATTYRNASGYAVAAVMLPLANAMVPRPEPTTWWPFWPGMNPYIR